MSSRARRSMRAVTDAHMRLGAAKRRTRLSDVINHYINVSDADLIEREVARDLPASVALRFKHWRLLTTARTGESAARSVGTAPGSFEFPARTMALLVITSEAKRSRAAAPALHPLA